MCTTKHNASSNKALTTDKDDGILPEDELSPAEFELLLSVLENRPGLIAALDFDLHNFSESMWNRAMQVCLSSGGSGLTRLTTLTNRWVATGENVI